MSIPSGQPTPPGGYPSQYGAAPPPRKSGISGWQIAGFGCLALFLMAAIGGILLVRAAKDQWTHPSKSSPLGVGIIAGKAGIDGALLQRAIVAYHQQHGYYPNTLMDLVKEGRVDGKSLHNELDDNPSPGHISWIYTKPAEGAPGETPILEEPYKITIGGGVQSSSIVITLNGQSQSNVSSQHPQTQ